VLLELAKASAPEAGSKCESFDGLRHLPQFESGHRSGGHDAERRGRFYAQPSRKPMALLIASPEYGHSLPGSLKNAIDWLIGSGELESKVVAVTAAVPIAERGRLGLKALCDTLGRRERTDCRRRADRAWASISNRGVRELMSALVAAVYFGAPAAIQSEMSLICGSVRHGRLFCGQLSGILARFSVPPPFLSHIGFEPLTA